ncbi:hypothetical protein BC832DRAFT_624072 [Gaertneriomyces semiglobifer]|nr:hypothetical protein BC832DRAFT_624072 [Gaertneriomyces semiglobifer]
MRTERTNAKGLADEIADLANELCQLDTAEEGVVKASALSARIQELAQQLDTEKKGVNPKFFEVVDNLDDNGVKIWNESVKKRGSAATVNRTTSALVAHRRNERALDEMIWYLTRIPLIVRESAFALLSLAAPLENNMKASFKLAGLALKTGKSFLDADKHDDARRFYDLSTSLVLKEAGVAGANSPESSKLLALNQAYKAELEFLISESAVSFMLLRQVMKPEIISQISRKEAQQIVHICLQCAQKASKQADGIQWCQIGIDLIDQDVEHLSFAGKVELKTKLLLLLANLYFESKAVEAAEQAVDLALQESPSLLIAYALKAKCLAGRPGSAALLQEIFAAAVENCTDVDHASQLSLFFGLIHMLAKEISSSAAAEAADLLVQKIVSRPHGTEDTVSIEKLKVLKMYFLVSDAGAEKDVAAQVEQILDSTTQLSQVQTYRLLLWQAADKAAQEARWSDALSWYKSSLRLLADDNTDVTNMAIVRRKLGVCQLEIGDPEAAYACFAQAAEVEPSPLNDFLCFVASVESSFTAQALKHLKRIPCEKDTFHYFVNAAQIVFEKGAKDILQQILRMIVLSPVDWTQEKHRLNLLIVVRCLIRLTKPSVEVGNDTTVFKEVTLYIRKAYEILKGWKAEDADTFRAEVDWLYRMTWNVALPSAIAEQTEIACSLFELTADILELLTEVNLQKLQSQKVCLFASAAGHVSLARQDEENHLDHLQKALTLLARMRDICVKVVEVSNSTQEDAVLYQSIYLEYEIKVKQQAWSELEGIIGYAESVSAPSDVFERMADIVTRHQAPSAVVFITVQATMNALMKRESKLDLEKFSQWFRILIRTALVSNKTAALGLFQQVLAVLKSTCNETYRYPSDEVSWLMVTSWNIGCEYFSLNEHDHGRTWCEIAISLADYTDSPQASQIRAAYTEMLGSS